MNFHGTAEALMHRGQHTAARLHRARYAYAFIAPFFLLFALFMAMPIVFSLLLSFHRWNGIMEPEYVGLSHYRRALADPSFWNALRNTALFTCITVAASTVCGLALAVYLNAVEVLRKFFRGVFFVPAIVSLVVVSLIWKLMLNGEIGLVNQVVDSLRDSWANVGLIKPGGQHLRFLDHPNRLVPLVTVALVNVWATVGFNTVIFLAGLQGIPTQLYEAAIIDGAGDWQCFRRITLPMLRPVLLFVVMATTIDALQVFVLPAVMNKDNESTMTVVYFMYRNAFDFYKMGYASAVAYILFGMTAVLSYSLRRLLRERATEVTI